MTGMKEGLNILNIIEYQDFHIFENPKQKHGPRKKWSRGHTSLIGIIFLDAEMTNADNRFLGCSTLLGKEIST